MKNQTYSAYAILTDGTEVKIYSLYTSIIEAAQAVEKFSKMYNCSETWIKEN